MSDEREFAEDQLGSRRATSHERMSGRPWDASYQDGSAPWDIGRPQEPFVRVAKERGFEGPVLDAGCGTGEHALLAASLGLTVVGVDVAETALEMARSKAAERGLAAEFVAADALQFERLGRQFRTVLDCGLFHTFDSKERKGYVVSLASVTELGATLYVLCFSDEGAVVGPHPVSEADVRAAFGPGTGWEVVAIEAERIQTKMHENGAAAWFATVQRL